MRSCTSHHAQSIFPGPLYLGTYRTAQNVGYEWILPASRIVAMSVQYMGVAIDLISSVDVMVVGELSGREYPAPNALACSS